MPQHRQMEKRGVRTYRVCQIFAGVRFLPQKKFAIGRPASSGRYRMCKLPQDVALEADDFRSQPFVIGYVEKQLPCVPCQKEAKRRVASDCRNCLRELPPDGQLEECGVRSYPSWRIGPRLYFLSQEGYAIGRFASPDLGCMFELPRHFTLETGKL